jgi:hypothetical protein
MPATSRPEEGARDPVAGARSSRVNALGERDCQAPNQWWPKPGLEDLSDSGFRVWVCASSAATALSTQDQVLDMGSRLWGSMTLPVPDGMGPPIPDDDDTWGSGKIDIYVLGKNQCVTRDGACRGIDESRAVAVTRGASPHGVPGRPKASSGFLRLSRGRLTSPSIVADLAHEFFHVLQFAHHAHGDYWYDEATATWAEWVYTRTETRADVYDAFTEFQRNNRSLLESPGSHQYHSWVWPLFQADHAGMGAPSVFSTWQSFESLTTFRELDAAVNESLPFESFYRDFAVTNLQPQPYRPRSSTGLEAVTWQQLDDDRRNFPRNQHVLTHAAVQLRQGSRPEVRTRYRANVVALAAQSDEFLVSDARVHEITIDVSSLTNGDNVDLDIVGRLDGGTDEWVRIAATGDEVTICRDQPTDDFDRFYVVIANHSFARRGNGPSPAQRVAGNYRVTAKDHCDLPERWAGSVQGDLRVYGDGSVAEESTATVVWQLDNINTEGQYVTYTYRALSGSASWVTSGTDDNGCTWSGSGSDSLGNEDTITTQLKIYLPKYPDLEPSYTGGAYDNFYYFPIVVQCDDYSQEVPGPYSGGWFRTGDRRPFAVGMTVLEGTSVFDDGYRAYTVNWHFEPA